MRHLLIITAALLLLEMAAPPVLAQADVEWEALTKESMDLYEESQHINIKESKDIREGKYERAVVIAKKALEVAEKNAGSDHPNVATSLHNLAELYR